MVCCGVPTPAVGIVSGRGLLPERWDPPEGGGGAEASGGVALAWCASQKISGRQSNRLALLDHAARHSCHPLGPCKAGTEVKALRLPRAWSCLCPRPQLLTGISWGLPVANPSHPCCAEVLAPLTQSYSVCDGNLGCVSQQSVGRSEGWTDLSGQLTGGHQFAHEPATRR